MLIFNFQAYNTGRRKGDGRGVGADQANTGNRRHDRKHVVQMMRRKTDRSTETMPKSVVSRVEEKLLALLHQEPAALVGVEEEVEWIKTELRGIEYGDGNEFTAELGDVAYDLEDALNKELELSKGKLSALPAPSPSEFSPLDPHDSAEIIEGGTALLDQKALYSKMKKKARRIQDKFRSMNDFLKDFESDEPGNSGMVKELLTISSSAVDVMEELISRREQTIRSLREGVVFDMDNLRSLHKVAMEMEHICSEILDIKKGVSKKSSRWPQPWFVDLPKDEKFRKMSVMRWWGDVGDMTESVASRAIEKLTALLVQEPVALIGAEEQLQWIQKQLRQIIVHRHFREEAVDVAYDVEDFIDYIILISTSQARSEEDVIDFDDNQQLHKKLEWIINKIHGLPPPVFEYSMSTRVPVTETDWLKLSSVLNQNMANTVSSPVIEKITALLAQDSLPSRAKKSARRVQDKFKLMNGFVKDLESEELDDRGLAWMEELCHVSLSTVDVIDQFMKSRQQEKRSQVGQLGRDVLGFRHLISQHKLGRKMDYIYSKIIGLYSRRPEQAYGHINQRTVLPSKSSPNPENLNQEPDFVSFSDDVHAIIRRLLSEDPSFSVISIVGMPGIGKTTLAKLIYNNKAIVEHFPFRVWTSATDWNDLFRDIIGEHIDNKMPWSWKREDTMRKKLNTFLTGKKYLIVLEDAYTVVFLNELVRTLPDASNGSKMILTTNTMRVASKLERGSVHHHVRLRGDDESWALFTHALKVNISREMLQLKRQIVRTCGGLPIAIVKLADLLSTKDSTNALQELNQDQQLWSYTLSRINDDLSLYMQRCLYYFSLFPKDFEIPARRLIMLWIAEGLVKTDGENEAPEDVAERYLITLIGKGMVRVTKNKLNGNIKTCLLPDALWQYWSSKALQATFLRVGTGMIRRLSDHLDKGDVSFDHIHGDRKKASGSLQLLYGEVVSFLSFDTREGSEPGEDIRHFLCRCISSNCLLLLRVLDLENTFRPKLPEEIGKLTQLRYLGLRSTFLDILPSSINKLQSLQTLDIKHTNISNCPSLIWNMQQLRQLYLNDSCHIKLMPQISVGSSSLRVLVGLFVDEETPVQDGLDRFFNLRKLGLTFLLLPSQQEAVVGWISKLKDLQSLRLKSINGENQPGVIELKSLTSHTNLSCLYLLGSLKNPSMVSLFPDSLIELTLSGSELEEDPMQKLDKLPNLKVLRLLAKSYTGKKMVCSSGGFPQLQVLKLWKLEQLEEWNVDEGAMEALWDIDIRSCKRLKMLPVVLQHRALLELKLTHMPSQFVA